MLKFDLDGVLIDFQSRVFAVLEDEGFEITDRDQWQFKTYPKLTDAQLWQRINKTYDLWTSTETYPGVGFLMRSLWQMTATPIQIITARPAWCADRTIMHLNRVMDGIPYLVAMVDSGDQKINYLDPDDILVEDRRKTCIDLSRAGVRTILVDMPYNQIVDQERRYPHITRIPALTHLNPRHFI